MGGVRGLSEALKSAVDRRIAKEARALRGTIKNGMFQSGSKAYPFKQAVDCNTSAGNKVWAQLTPNNLAVIVGA